MKTAVIYLRVSTKEQAERDADPEGYSIPAQRDACRRKAEALGAVVVEEFIDRGESAKTADRPELQRMLARLRDGRDIDYLIVHKVDRLARSRADDVSIGLALKTAGTQLVSVTENIDETPSGKLLHGIMASIAEFYSQNLASEILKGSVQKAKAGGTLSLAPLGYLNVRKVVDGREVRTVELDPERAPHVRFAFQAYATGDWSLRSLLEELSDRGLTNRATARRPERPLHLSKLAKLLTNPYYIGIVSYRGELYPGKHPPLIPAAVFDKVQAVLAAHRLSGDRRQKHHHFLKGTVLCGRCGSRLSVGYFNGNGGRYRYFFCLGRHSRRTTCDLPYLSVDEVEQAVEAHWQARVHLDPDLLERVRRNLLAELKVEHRQATKLIAQEQVRIDAIEAQRVRWAEKSAAGVIPDDIGRTKQNDLTVQLIRATHDRDELIKVATEDTRIFSDTLDLTRDCVEGYRQADDDLKRDWNQAFFEWIRVDVDRAVESKLKPPFDTLLDPTTLRYYGRPAGGAAPTKRHRDPGRVPVGTSSGAGVLVGVGSSKSLLVELWGIEPQASSMRPRRSTN